MCVIIDTNVMSLFADKNNADYEPVRKWIRKGRGKLVYGGSTYLREMKNVNEFLNLVTDFKLSKKTVVLNQQKVDEYEQQIKAKEPNRNFDDPHLIAMVCVSECKVLCTEDTRAEKYIQNKDLYIGDAKPPSIYKRAKHEHLLCDDNIVNCCK